MKMHYRFLAATALFAAAASLSVAAASGLAGRDVSVIYSSVDAGTVDGATLLFRRIEAASAQVCATLDQDELSTRARTRSRRQACERRLTADAVSRVNSPVLADIYRSMHREPLRAIALAR
jgi:UrcA family protein